MRNSESPSYSGHFDLMQGFARYCADRGLTVFEHRFDALAFGSWLVVAGNPHRRLRFTWQGKESFLEIEESRFESQGAQPVWKPLPGRSAPRDSSEAFEAMQAQLEKEPMG